MNQSQFSKLPPIRRAGKTQNHPPDLTVRLSALFVHGSRGDLRRAGNLNLKTINLLFHIINYLSPIYQYKIIGESMNPVFYNGDSVLVNRFAYLIGLPKKWDIVAVPDPRDGKVLIKRIIKAENKLYFVQGDNMEDSTDSRSFGMLSKENIIGKVFYVL